MTRLDTLIVLLIGWCTLPCIGRGEGPRVWNDPGTRKQIIESLERVQANFYDLALAYDQTLVDGLQYYPIPDWLIVNNPEKRSAEYKWYFSLWRAFDRDKAFAQRIDNTRYVSHFDAIRLYPCPYGEITTDSLRSMRLGKTFYDPFGGYYGYVATGTDYALISEGPDRVSDILGFMCRPGGGYELERKYESLKHEKDWAAERAKALYTGPPREWGTHLRFDVNAIYDPTNGLLSDGDILFHKRGGDNFMFSYQPDFILTRRNLVKRDLQESLKDLPVRRLPDTPQSGR